MVRRVRRECEVWGHLLIVGISLCNWTYLACQKKEEKKDHLVCQEIDVLPGDYGGLGLGNVEKLELGFSR